MRRNNACDTAVAIQGQGRTGIEHAFTAHYRNGQFRSVRLVIKPGMATHHFSPASLTNRAIWRADICKRS